MDWDLWGPSYNQVSLDRSNDTQPGSQFDYYFGYVPDVLEETALNEKYCVQVLSIMNTKADVEIDQLEEDLLVLQSQLVWTEDEERSDKCCAALREKIDNLNSTIWSLKNKEEHDVDAYLSVHREPAEKLHEIMKVLLKNYLEKYEQPLDVIVREPISHTSRHATDLGEGKQFSKFDSIIAVKQEIQEPTFAPSEKCIAPNSPPKLEAKKSDFLKEVKTADIIVKRTKVDASEHMTDHSNGKKSHVSELRISREEVSEHRSTSMAKDMILDPSLESEEKKTNLSGIIKPLDVIVKETSSDSLGLTTDHLDERKKVSNFDSNGAVKEEIREPTVAPSGSCTAPTSSSKREGKETVFLKEVEPANTIIKASSLETSKPASVCSDGSKSLCKPVSKVHGMEKVNEPKSTAADRSITLNSFPKCAGKGTNIPKANKPVDASVKNFGSDSLRHAIGLHCNNGKKNLSNSSTSLNAIGQGKSGDSIVKSKKINSTSENTRNGCINESKVALTGKNDSSNSLLKVEEKTSPILTGKVQDAGITVVSNVDLQVQHEKDTTQQKLVEKRKTRPCDGQKDDIVANDESNLNCPLKSQRLKEPQRRFLPSSMSVQEGSVSMSSISNAKKRRKSSIDDNVTLVEIKNETKWKKFLDQDRCGAQVCGVASDVSKKSVPRSQKIRKKCPDSPIILGLTNLTFQKDLQKLHRDTTDAASEEVNRITNPRSTGISDNEAVPSLPASRLDDLNNLPKVDLRAIAKQYKLTGYYALKKSDLIQQIATRLQ